MKKVFKSIISLALVLLVVAGVMTPIAPTAQAISIPTHQGNSDMWLVDANTKKTASTIYLYGRADYICLKMYQDEDTRGLDRFCFEMYSDSKYKKCVASYYSNSKRGTEYVRIPMAFDDLKSGTYYVKTYVNKYETGDALLNWSRSTDSATVRKCKIKIVKAGADSVKDMNTVMYGYENTENGPRIYWYSVPGATGYYVYRKNPSTGKYSKIKTVKDGGTKFTSYVDTAMKGKNCTRYYKVVAYKGSSKTPLSLLSMKTKILPTPEVSISVRSSNKIVVKWKEIGSRNDYHIYIRGGAYTDWYEVDEVTSGGSQTTIDLSEIQPQGKKLETNTKYYFTVIADVDGIPSGYNTTGVGVWYMNVPEVLPCTYPETGGVTVSWTESVGADKYRIYRKSNPNDDYEYLASVNGETFTYTDETVSSFDRYYYQVRAYRDDKLSAYNGGGEIAINLVAPTLESFEVKENGKAVLDWSTPQSNYCGYYHVLVNKNGDWERYGYSSYSSTQATFNLDYAIYDLTFSVKAFADELESPYDTEGITLEYRPQPEITDIYAIDGKGAYISWKAPVGAETSYIYRKTADSDYELIYCTDAAKFFWDETVEPDVKYTYKLVYSYKGKMVEEAAFEKEIEYVFGSEKIVDKVYLPYSYSSGEYAVQCENSALNYYLFVKGNGEWQKTSFSHLNYRGNLLFEKGEGVTEYAIAIVTSDGRVSMISEPSFVVDYNNQNADAVSIAFEETVAIFTWNPEEVDGDEVVIYRDGELLARAPAVDGIYRDETAGVNKRYNYKAYINKGGFLSANAVSASNEVITTPTFTVSNTEKGVKFLLTSEELGNGKYVIGRKTADGSWKTVKKDYTLFCSSYYLDSTAKSGVEYTYRIKVKPYGCDAYGDYVYFTQKYLSAPEITKIRPKSNGVRIYWSSVPGAEKYRIRYFSYDDDQWHTWKTVSSSTTAITDTTIKSGECRTYAIAAVSGDCRSVYTEDGYRFLKEPKITSVKKTSNGIRIECDSVKAASGYVFYCREKGSSDWYLIGPSTGVKSKNGKVVYTHENKYLKNGTTYYFKVKAKCASYYSVCETSSAGIKYTG